MKKFYRKISVSMLIICLVCFGISGISAYASEATPSDASGKNDSTTTQETAKNILSTPKLNKSTTAAGGGIKVSWGKVSGASGYAVFRKTSGGSWTRIGTTTYTNYTDKTASAGTTYYYTVRAYKGSLSTADKNKYNESTYWSSYDKTGVTGKYIKMPVVKSASAEASGTKLTWDKVSRATGYVIWRKTSSTSWTRIGTTTGTSFTDTSSRNPGTTYYYTIRAYSGDISTANSNTFNSNYWSYYDTTGTKVVYLYTAA